MDVKFSVTFPTLIQVIVSGFFVICRLYRRCLPLIQEASSLVGIYRDRLCHFKPVHSWRSDGSRFCHCAVT